MMSAFTAPQQHAALQLVSLLPLANRLHVCPPRAAPHQRAVRARAKPHDDILPLSPESFLAACKEARKEPGKAALQQLRFSVTMAAAHPICNKITPAKAAH